MRREVLAGAVLACFLPQSLSAQPDPDTIAQRATVVAGSPYAVAAIRFTFVVVEQGVIKKKRSHLWCPRRHVVEVTADSVYRVDLRSGGDSRAYAWFINDSYWLFAPSKLLDQGVRRSMVADQLQLTFDRVGLTAGDRYLVHVDQRTGLVDSWSFELEGGRSGTYRWSDYRKVGPLWLAALRQRADGQREIRFEELAVLDSCPL